jgi:hypothetical protein
MLVGRSLGRSSTSLILNKGNHSGSQAKSESANFG